MNKNYVAIIGRSNVGKSTLFNRLIKKKISITSNEEGTTRDRIIFPCSWTGRDFALIDTGGFSKNTNDLFQEDINKQVEIAISFADIIIFTVSLKEGVLKEDLIIASKLKQLKNKKIIVAVNKSDNKTEQILSSDFYQFGFENVIPISAIHGIGISNLLDSIAQNLKLQTNEIEELKYKISIIGKPNVGKSSLLNVILKNERAIVSNIPGTTRDSIDTDFVFNQKNYVIIDTAGIKKNKDSLSDIEFYSELRSNLAIERSNFVLLVLDYTQGINHIDENLISYLKKTLKPTLILINKSDLIPQENRKEIEKDIQQKFKFASYIPIIFISAKSKKNISKIFEWIEKIRINSTQDINKAKLNKFLQDIQMIKHPPRNKGFLVTLNYITYHCDERPHFIIFANKSEYIHFSYKRFIENQIRNIFNFEGVHIKITYKDNK